MVAFGTLCLEEVDGRRWGYVVDAATLQYPLPPVEALGEILEPVVTMVNKMGFSAEAGPVQIFVSNHAIRRFIENAFHVEDICIINPAFSLFSIYLGDKWKAWSSGYKKKFHIWQIPRRFLLDMAALKVTSALCLSLLIMTLLLDPSCGNKEARDKWLSDTYRMLILCSSKTCNKHCIDEGATRGKCGFLIFRSFCFCTKECD